jgi:hypothetical protein
MSDGNAARGVQEEATFGFERAEAHACQFLEDEPCHGLILLSLLDAL